MGNNDFNNKPDYAINDAPGTDRRFPSVQVTSFFILAVFASYFLIQILLVNLLNIFGLVDLYQNSASFYYMFGSVYEILYIGLPALLIILYYNKDRVAFLRLNPMKGSEILLTVLIGLGVYVANMFLTEANYVAATLFSDITLPTTPEINGVADKIFFIIQLAIVAPVLEELLMRGVIMRGLEGKSKWFAIIITGVFFGMLHLSYYTIVPKILAGILLCYVVFTTNSLYAGIIVHLINNALSGLLELISTSSVEESGEEVITSIEELSVATRLNTIFLCVFISAIIIGIIIVLLTILKNTGKRAGADGNYIYKGGLREKLPCELQIKWYSFVPIAVTFLIMVVIMIGNAI